MNEVLENNALSVITEKNVVQFFAEKGLDPILEKIRKEVEAFKPDISSETGRKAVAAFAYKIAKMKTRMDDLGKNLVSGIKAQAKIIDAERGRAWDEIEKMQHEVRKPLTDWEQKEEKRVEAHKKSLDEINGLVVMSIEPTIDELNKRMTILNSYENTDFEEFAELAKGAKASARLTLTSKIESMQKAEKDRLELERLQKAEADRVKKENEDRIAKEAADKAKKDAEAESAAKIEQANREKKEADERAAKSEADRIAGEKKAEDDRIAAAKKAEDDKKAAEEKAARDQAAAVQAEKDRQTREKKLEEDAAAAREKDKKHKAKINGEAAAALEKICGFTPENSKQIVIAIAKGEIPNVKISY